MYHWSVRLHHAPVSSFLGDMFASNGTCGKRSRGADPVLPVFPQVPVCRFYPERCACPICMLALLKQAAADGWLWLSIQQKPVIVTTSTTLIICFSCPEFKKTIIINRIIDYKILNRLNVKIVHQFNQVIPVRNGFSLLPFLISA